MKILSLVAVIALGAISAAPALAETKTVRLSVPGMTCAACPITVKTALAKVQGVEKAEVSFEKKEAIVVYDDAKANVEKLKDAIKNAGYPATEKR
ncbi:MAG: mercury resistance system periplasmic binding protein MerP [Acidobacteria bacterium]|nr:mercury resistance system periplasmic binding protein MerP [Acidobacteriota bacterium]